MATSAHRHGARELDRGGPATLRAAAHAPVGTALTDLGRLAGNRAVAQAVAQAVQRKRDVTEVDFAADPPRLSKVGEPEYAYQASKQAFDTSLAQGGTLVAQILEWKAKRQLWERYWSGRVVRSEREGERRDREWRSLSVRGTGAKLGGLGYRTEAQVRGDRVDLGTARVPGQAGDPVPDADYRNTYLGQDRTFVADWNFATHDARRPPQLQPPTKPPGNSEIIWHQYKRALAELGLPKAAKRHGLREIHRTTVINPNTVNTIYWSDRAAVRGEEHVALPGTDDFTALLGSDNGRSAGRLLVQHGISLGATDIERIRYQRGRGAGYELRIEFRLDGAAGGGRAAGNGQNDNNAPAGD